MTTPIFSQAAIYRLQQLAAAVHRQTGVRHRLSTPASLAALLSYSERTQNPEVATCYQAFNRLLDEDQRQSLQRQGVTIKPPATGLTFTREAG